MAGYDAGGATKVATDGGLNRDGQPSSFRSPSTVSRYEIKKTLADNHTEYHHCRQTLVAAKSSGSPMWRSRPSTLCKP
ncbi:hypothetical protein ACVILL_000835 [Bradyrhizobium sp. USDA 3364]